MPAFLIPSTLIPDRWLKCQCRAVCKCRWFKRFRRCRWFTMDSSIGVGCVGVGRVSEDAWNCLAHSQLAETHAVAVKKQNSSCELDGLCLCLCPKLPNSHGLASRALAAALVRWLTCRRSNTRTRWWKFQCKSMSRWQRVKLLGAGSLSVGRGRKCCTT